MIKQISRSFRKKSAFRFTDRSVRGKLKQEGTMRGEVYRFVAVDFIYDENVAGNLYWYLCPEEQVFVGDEVEAPIGRHNRLQRGIVRRIMFAERFYAPYPLDKIKRVAGKTSAAD